jgi:ribosomal protein L37AE/L43A
MPEKLLNKSVHETREQAEDRSEDFARHLEEQIRQGACPKCGNARAVKHEDGNGLTYWQCGSCGNRYSPEPTKEHKMFCHNCGKPASGLNCQGCGARLVGEPYQSTPNSPSLVGPYQEEFQGRSPGQLSLRDENAALRAENARLRNLYQTPESPTGKYVGPEGAVPQGIGAAGYPETEAEAKARGYMIGTAERQVVEPDHPFSTAADFSSSPHAPEPFPPSTSPHAPELAHEGAPSIGPSETSAENNLEGMRPVDEFAGKVAGVGGYYKSKLLSNPQRKKEADDKFSLKTAEGDYQRPDWLTSSPADEARAHAEGFTIEVKAP